MKDLRTIEPRIGDSALECRSSLCRLRWSAGKADPTLLTRAIKFIYLIPGNIPPANNELYLILRSNTAGIELGRTADSAIARVKSRRTTLLYNLRTGRTAPPPNLPVERLPKE